MDYTASRKLLRFDDLGHSDSEPVTQPFPSRKANAFAFDLARREQLTFLALDEEDTAALPGMTLTARNLTRARKLAVMEGLVRKLALTGFSLTGEPCSRITLDARDAAITFIRNLDTKARLPKVAPDGEGGLLFLWNGEDGDLAVIIEGTTLHMVVAPSGPHAQHVENIAYGLGPIPPVVFKAIPRE